MIVKFFACNIQIYINKFITCANNVIFFFLCTISQRKQYFQSLCCLLKYVIAKAWLNQPIIVLDRFFKLYKNKLR